MPLDVRVPGQMEAVFDRISKEWGRLDFVVHSIAFAPRMLCMDELSTCLWMAF
jgi:enoyl-[acyl-carrier protein] reductase I